MKQFVRCRITGLLAWLLLFVIVLCTSFINTTQDDRILSCVVNPGVQELKLYWKNEQGEILRNFDNLKSFIERNHRKLIFAMNGGMYTKDNSPQGLYIENQHILNPLDTSKGTGNFYMLPNGVFYLTLDNKPGVCRTEDLKKTDQFNYATQSGPILLIDGAIHPAFKMGSENLNIRNGVGILPDNTVLFAMSKTGINFYDFAQYFKSKGCKNALYLDGFVSRAYLPEKNWIQKDGNFGVMIGVTEKQR